MRQLHRTTPKVNTRRRNSTASGLTFGRLATTVAVGAIIILLAVTFLGDYLRVPQLTVSASPAIISPNNDGTQDSSSLSYIISEEAAVSVDVVNQNDVVVKTLSIAENRPAGQYVAVWDGTDNDGRVVNDGRYNLQVTAAGPSRSATQGAEVQVDTEPPTLRLTNLDNISRVADPALTIEGLTESGATVYQAGNAQAVIVDAQGYFQIERQLTEGANILEIIASDRAGNTARTSHEVALITEPPELTILAPANDQWFNETVLEVTGLVPAASAVTVNAQPVVLQEDGTFRHELILQEGDNNVRVEATDDVGNVTVRERLVHLKTTPPILTLNLDDGNTFQQSTVQLTGRTDPGSIVLVNNQVVPVSPLGEFQTPLNLSNGQNVIDVETRDIAGNTTNLSRRVSFESPVSQNEVTRFLNNFPSLTALGTPLLIIVPSLLLLGYLFTRPVSIVLAADTDNFVPGLPQEGKVINLSLDLSKSARTTVDVRNRFNRSVATITSRRQREAGQHDFYWDGYDDNGYVVPGGEYTITATASTPGASVSSAVTVTLREDPVVYSQYGKRSSVTAIEEQPEVVQRSSRRRR